MCTVLLLEALRAAQEAEAEKSEKAIYGCGEYGIANNFMHLEVQPRTAWKQMPPQRRAKHIEKFWSTNMEDAQNFEILLGNVLGEAPSEKALSASSNDCHTSGGEELSEPPEETGALSPDPIAISVQVSDLSLPSTLAVVFQAIWKKADELIKTRGKIVNCLGNPKGRMLESRREDRPHLVKKMAGGKITCDCPN